MLCNPLLMLSGLGGWRAEGQNGASCVSLSIGQKVTMPSDACASPAKSSKTITCLKRFGKTYLKIQWTSVKATDLGPACRKPLPEPTARAEVRGKNVCETVQLLSCIWTYEMSDTD
jgi:hypothetical protein